MSIMAKCYIAALFEELFSGPVIEVRITGHSERMKINPEANSFGGSNVY